MAAQQDEKEGKTRHALKNRWQLSWHKPKGSSWSAKINIAGEFSTIEEFWHLFNNVTAASQVASGSNLHLFKHGIHPSWEDKANARGGEWRLSIGKGEDVDDIWQDTVLSLVGGLYADDDDICGVVLAVRKKQTRIEFWTRNARNEAVCRRICKQWCEAANLPGGALEYMSHEATLNTTKQGAKGPGSLYDYLHVPSKSKK